MAVSSSSSFQRHQISLYASVRNGLVYTSAALTGTIDDTNQLYIWDLTAPDRPKATAKFDET